jgi:hypothetical protein
MITMSKIGGKIKGENEKKILETDGGKVKEKKNKIMDKIKRRRRMKNTEEEEEHSKGNKI